MSSAFLYNALGTKNITGFLSLILANKSPFDYIGPDGQTIFNPGV
jgi:hypothetical protein